MAKLTLEQIEAMLDGDGEADDASPDLSDDADDKPDYSGGSEGVAARELRAFIERAERLAAEKAEIAEQEKDVFAEAKARGYDVKVLKKVLSIRKRNRDDVAEEDAILEMYLSALGMM